MAITRTKGYTDIVKIAEAALNGDKEKAIKHIKAYLIKYPESDLVYPFSAILRGDLNPSGLHFCASAEPVNDASALPIHSVSVNGVAVTGCPYRVQDSCNFRGSFCTDETCNIRAKPVTER